MTHRRTHAADFSFFQGIPLDELGPLLEGLERRTYAAGSVVLAEGDRTKEIYIPESGSAEVVITDPDGSEQRVGRVVPGGSVGEISVLTGQPAVATVRATADLSVVVMTEADLARIASDFPQIYRNLGTILAERLARTDRLVVGRTEGRLTLLEDLGAPPLLAFALACSIAWHTREPTVLIVLDDDPPQELADLTTTSPEPPWRSGRQADEAGADLIVAPPTGPFGPESVVATLEALFGLFKHILLLARTGTLPPLSTAVVVRLAGADGMPSGGVDGPLTVRGWTAVGAWSRPDLDRVVSVPALGSDEEQSLRDGLLTSSSAAGRAIGWAARDRTGLKVGLALGAGSIRGYAHVGVIDVLRRTGLDFDYITGTSVGAAVAALLAGGYDADEIATNIDAFTSKLFKLTVPVRSFLSDRGMRAYLRGVDPTRRFDELPVPLALIAADIVSQQELVLRRGLVWPAVLASIAIPGIYPAQVMAPHVAVDGGVLNPLPVNVAGEMGAGTVIGVKLGGLAPSPEHELEVVAPRGRPPAVLPVLLRSIELMQRGIATEPTDATVITIAPICDPTGVGLRNMQEGRRYIEDGVKAAEAALPRLAAALPWLR